ncbi:MAG: hypothetical protein U5K54_25750 [Cytophagales bacterium]|nr:hypothetical protein [Cytophagales bacterium]
MIYKSSNNYEEQIFLAAISGSIRIAGALANPLHKRGWYDSNGPVAGGEGLQQA